jgi:tetratricopeptide (TPR) repeat protein
MDSVPSGEFEAQCRGAEALLVAGDYGEAYGAFQRALLGRTRSRAQQDAPPDSLDLAVIERVAELAVLFGDHDAADGLIESYAAFARRAGNRYLGDYGALKLAQIRLARGRLRHAERALSSLGPEIDAMDRAELSPDGLARWEADLGWRGRPIDQRVVLLTQVCLVKGQLLSATGQYRAAVLLFDHGSAGSRSPAVASVPVLKSMHQSLRLECGRALLEMGEFAAAQESLAGLRRDVDRVIDVGIYVGSVALLGKLCMLRGAFGEAVTLSEQVIDACRNGGFAEPFYQAILNLSHIQILLNQTLAASRRIVMVRDAARRSGNRGLEVKAAFLLGLAQTRRRSATDGVEIAPTVSELWGVVEEPPQDAPDAQLNPLDLAASSSFLGLFEERALALHLTLRNRDLPAAASLLTWMEDMFGETDSTLIQIRLNALRSLLAVSLGKWADAAAGLESQRPLLRKLGLRPDLLSATSVLRRCYKALGRPDEESDALAVEARTLLEELTATLPEEDQDIFLLNKSTTEEEHLASLVDAIIRLKGRIATGPWYSRLWLRFRLIGRIEALMTQARRDRAQLIATKLGAGTRTEALGSEGWRSVLKLIRHPIGHATVCILVLPDRAVLVHRGFLRLRFGVSPVSRVYLRELVRGWHEAVYKRIPGRHLGPGRVQQPDSEQFGAASQHLAAIADALQIPSLIANLPSMVRSLTIEPDDCLHGVPFGALQVNGDFLLRRFALTIGSSSRIGREQSRPRAGAPSALLVAISRGNSEIDPLPGTTREVAQVRTLLPQRTEVSELGDDATRVALMNALPSATLCHIACHGTFRRGRPDQSGLLLVPEPGRTELLTLRDLATLDLSRVQHVTLSSCWSADNFVLPGRWIISLPQVLRAAGAGSVLACLWPVDDAVAISFMASFYQHLRNLGRADALRRTQLEFLDRRADPTGSGDQSAAYYWAGFALYGDPDRIAW